MTPALIHARRLGRAFGEGPSRVQALVDLDLDVEAGERLAITGPSGAGKSTLLNLLGALDGGYLGTLQIAGAELHALGDRQLSALRNRTIGFVFHSFNLLPSLDVAANLALPAAFAEGGAAAGADPSALRARALELLARVGLDASVAARRPLELSGGQRQRVAIARALLLKPALLLCDEPTGSLDRAHADAVLDLFEELARENGSALLIVTHDPLVIERQPRVLHLEAGRLMRDERRQP